ncbi:glyoxylase-like metal-dependent hydrolase (beta-lactamase superfamily II) [Bacillus pakistanensis]|uniref:Glyoxylase-like metal-dependent hydrolase (Beta-lactamase superfamily II) n=1 Tax=Rossellomorea pakistanensis TaxID=992288 RepID=A0ABS2N708_9BACI|nr:MBL fold metallo-hydrolase [Bacillus pakistanensis]MBM7583628.1 glyoxylase-like metal-dependent hydrolase (beta-lactamase superfamily II) [Bacillus pakistanensis]
MDIEGMSYGNDYKYIPATSIGSGTEKQIAANLCYQTIQIVNVCYVCHPENGEWVLVDAGMPKSADTIIAFADEHFGSNNPPNAIILTHGHFDHVGAIIELVNHWDVPVYAHPLEIPYLTGKENYPEPDSTVEGGLIAKMSPLFPNESINLGSHIHELPSDGSVPEMDGWRWIHTPGHTPGHVSFFREEDRSLIVGDAFVTVKQDSLYNVLTQDLEMNGPPRYFTTDWEAAWNSVRKLETLKPAVAITGHGSPLAGEALLNSLHKLVGDFETIAIPDYGKYVNKKKH